MGLQNAISLWRVKSFNCQCDLWLSSIKVSNDQNCTFKSSCCSAVFFTILVPYVHWCQFRWWWSSQCVAMKVAQSIFFPLTIFFPLLDKAIFISASFNDSLWNIVALLRFVLQLDFLLEDDLEQKNRGVLFKLRHFYLSLEIHNLIYLVHMSDKFWMQSKMSSKIDLDHLPVISATAAREKRISTFSEFGRNSKVDANDENFTFPYIIVFLHWIRSKNP